MFFSRLNDYLNTLLSMYSTGKISATGNAVTAKLA